MPDTPEEVTYLNAATMGQTVKVRADRDGTQWTIVAPAGADAAQPGPDLRLVPCPSCHGKGQIDPLRRYTCPACGVGGTGLQRALNSGKPCPSCGLSAGTILDIVERRQVLRDDTERARYEKLVSELDDAHKLITHLLELADGVQLAASKFEVSRIEIAKALAKREAYRSRVTGAEEEEA